MIVESGDDYESDRSMDDENLKPIEIKMRAEKRLERLLKQSSEDPFQHDVTDDLDKGAKGLYDNLDNQNLLLNQAEKLANAQGKTFQRNQHIAVLDYLKEHKQDAKAYKIKYQYRSIVELLDTDKVVQHFRARHNKDKLQQIADKTTNDKLTELNEE